MNLDFFENKYFYAIFAVFAALYTAQISPQLPKFLVRLFQNPIFRVAILFLVLVRAYKDPQFSIVVAAAFVMVMNLVNEHLLKEKFGDAAVSTTIVDISGSAMNRAQASTTVSTDNSMTGPSIVANGTTINVVSAAQPVNQEDVKRCENIQMRINTIKSCIDNVSKEEESLNCQVGSDDDKKGCQKRALQLNVNKTKLTGSLGMEKTDLDDKCKNVTFNVLPGTTVPGLTCDSI